MSWYQVITPARSALNPVLSDDPVIDLEHAAVRVFYTPGAQRIANHIGFIIAVGSGMSLLIAWILSVSGGPKPLEGLFTLLAFSIAGIPALESVWGKLRTFTIDIDLLMLLGAGLAAYVGSPFEGALLLFLFALSGGLEAYALGRTQRAIVALRDLAPKVATVIEDGSLVRVSLRQVRVGACVLVRPGEKVPVDGTVLRGSSSVDESAITGESIPRDCGEGDTVLAGTQNVNGRLEVRVTKLAADTTLARIVELVTSARHHPARAQRLIDRIGPTYSIVVILAAVFRVPKCLDDTDRFPFAGHAGTDENAASTTGVAMPGRHHDFLGDQSSGATPPVWSTHCDAVGEIGRLRGADGSRVRCGLGNQLLGVANVGQVPEDALRRQRPSA